MHYGYKNYTSENFNSFIAQTEEVGIVESYEMPYVKVKGLPKATIREVVLFESGKIGHVETLDNNYCHIVIYSHEPPLLGERVARTQKLFEMGVGMDYLGKIINPLGNLLNEKVSVLQPENYLEIEPPPKSIKQRAKITQHFETGVTIVDTLIPIGKGQRELVIGNRKIGKTEFLLQCMLSATKNGLLCVYGAIGKNINDLKKLESFIEHRNLKQNVSIIATYSTDPSPLIYLTPYCATTLAEFYMEKGYDVFLVLDDLTSHAKYYREMALIGKKFPGRNSYPADIFYTHSRLLERSGCFITSKGIKSITCMPVAETAEGDLSGYIQTNLMSMTDGHLYFDEELFLSGIRPPINYFLSVTRVGRQTQTKLKWSIYREISSFLEMYRNTQKFVHFGAEVNQGIKSTLEMGERITKNLFSQMPGQIMDSYLQIALLSLIWSQAIKPSQNITINEMVDRFVNNYNSNENLQKMIASIIDSCESFNQLLSKMSAKQNELLAYT